MRCSIDDQIEENVTCELITITDNEHHVIGIQEIRAALDAIVNSTEMKLSKTNRMISFGVMDLSDTSYHTISHMCTRLWVVLIQ